MFNKPTLLVGVFAAAALLYECLPREVNVKVISTGTVCDEKNQIVENYLYTDHGKIDISPDGLSKFSLPSDRGVALEPSKPSRLRMVARSPAQRLSSRLQASIACFIDLVLFATFPIRA
jgi:hypothetical protein